MRFIANIAVASALTFATLPVAAQNAITIDQDASFADASLRWTGATAGGYDARAAFKNVDGKLALCGVGIVTNIQLKAAVDNGLRGGTVKVNGKTVIKNFKFFAKAKRRNALERTKANCKVSNAPFPKRSDRIDFQYGNATFRN